MDQKCKEADVKLSFELIDRLKNMKLTDVNVLVREDSKKFLHLEFENECEVVVSIDDGFWIGVPQIQ